MHHGKMAASMRSWARFAIRRHCCGKRLHVPARYNSTSSSNILKLHERGIFQNVFPEDRTADLLRSLIGSPQCFYCGFDPTADSLHIGNLVALMALLHCQRGGHHPIVLIGGATSQIGDPSGKTTERKPLDLDSIVTNVQSIKNSVQRIFTNHERFIWNNKKELQPLRILDNADWYANRNIIEFLSMVGRHFKMSDLLSRHSVQSRLNSSEGMNFTEFTYQVFQAYDWLYLYKKYNCIVQIGGNDQMGNIVSGYEFIRRVTNKTVFGLTVPLVTSTSGNKLGKTAGNAVWLNPDKTTPFDLYQYFVRLADADMEQYLKLFTFLPDNEVEDIVRQHKRQPESRKAQKKLAENVTLLVHGEDGVKSAKRCTDALYSGTAEALAVLSDKELSELFQEATTSTLLLEPGTSIFDVAMKAGCFSSEADAERVIKAGGLYINHRRVTQPDYVLIPGEHILPNGITLIRVGKKNYYIIKWLGL